MTYPLRFGFLALTFVGVSVPAVAHAENCRENYDNPTCTPDEYFCAEHPDDPYCLRVEPTRPTPPPEPSLPDEPKTDIERENELFGMLKPCHERAQILLRLQESV